MEWFNANAVVIIVTAILIICLFVYGYRNKKGMLYKAALYAVSKAEEAWGSQTGRIKFAEVYAYLSKQYPIVTFFFTESQMTKMIENALVEMKKILYSKQETHQLQEPNEQVNKINENL